MAKKVKTPEEVKAAMEKKTAKRTLFFGTFRKAFALFLAIAFTFAMVQIAFTEKTGGTVVQTGGTVAGDTGSNPVQSQDEPTSVDLAGDEPTVKEGETITDDKGNQVVGLSKADAVKLLNDVTAQAAKAGYNWSRKCYYTDDGALQVKRSNGKDATDDLNSIIHRVDENATLGGVVGGFLDITGKDEPLAAKKAKGSTAAPEGMKDKFLLKATALTEADVAQFVQSGNTYKFQLVTCDDPQKDGGNALHRATNDFITESEVASDISNALGSALSSLIKVDSSSIQFSEIVIVAEIKDGKLTNLSLNYLMDVKSLNLKLTLIGVIGSGKGRVEATYDKFVY